MKEDSDMKNGIGFFGLVAAVAIIGFTTAGCSGKKDGGDSASGEGKSSGGVAVNVSARGKIAANPASDFAYDLTEDGQGIVITRFTGNPSVVVVPATIEDFPVTEIGNEVFDGGSSSRPNSRSAITSIIIPDTVTKIGYRAFRGTAITRFDMPDSVTEIGEDLFEYCSKLTELRLSDNIELLRNLGGYSVGCLTALRKINLPSNLGRIQGSALVNTGELTELEIPANLTTVEFGDIRPTLDGPKWFAEGSNAGGGIITSTSNAFKGAGKLPLRTRQAIQALGYKGEF